LYTILWLTYLVTPLLNVRRIRRLENNKDRDGRDEQWEIQQEILKARKGGVNFDKVNERRQKVSILVYFFAPLGMFPTAD
jgi:hypothetical protein